MRVLTIFFLLCLSCSITAQVINTQFYGDTKGASLFAENSIALPDGGLLITGATNTPDTGGYRVMLMRVDANGQKLWQHTYMRGSAYWVDRIPGGGFIVGGRAERGAFQDVTGFVMKVDDDGKLVWDSRITNGIRSSVTHVKAMPDGRIAACGTILESEPADAKVSAFLTIFDENGTLIMYKNHVYNAKRDNLAFELEVDAFNEITFIWGPEYQRNISRYAANGTFMWQREMNDYFSSSYNFVSYEDRMTVTDDGNIVLLNKKYKDPNLLVIVSGTTGEVLRTISITTGQINSPVFLRGTGGINLYYTAYIPSINLYRLYTVTPDLQTNNYSIDSLEIGLFTVSNIAAQNDSILYLTGSAPYQKIDVQVKVLKRQSDHFIEAGLLYFSNGQTSSDEFFEGRCVNSKGEYFALGRKKNDQKGYFNYIVVKTDADGRLLNTVIIGVASEYVGIAIQPMKDGGALILSLNDRAWRLDENAEVIWEKTLTYGYLFTDSQNEFSVVSDLFVSANEAYTVYRHYDASGNLIKEHNFINNHGINDKIFGGVIDPNDRIILYGNGDSARADASNSECFFAILI